MPQKRRATKRETPKGSTKAEKKQQKKQPTRARRAQTSPSSRHQPSPMQKSQKKRKPLIVRILFWLLGIVCALFITVLILAMTPLFTIEHVDYVASEHVTSEDLQQLAPIQDGTTLLSVNPFVLNAELRKNPWVESVVLERDFPSTLKISVVEKKVLALVETANAEVAWYLGEDKTWIEPAALPTGEGANNAESILSLATSSHTLLIKDVPDSLSPKAGAPVTDEEVLGALQFKQDFSTDLSEKIALYSAPNTAAYSATLQSGVVIALGDTSDIASKEAVILALLEKHPNQLTYINVKDPSKPTYRKIENTQTTTGTGVAK